MERFSPGRRRRRWGVALLLSTLGGCHDSDHLTPEAPLAAAPPGPPLAAAQAVPMGEPGATPAQPQAPLGAAKSGEGLPVVGDPLGLLGRKSSLEQDLEIAKADPSRLDPSTLQQRGRRAPAAVLERDPRAVARGVVEERQRVGEGVVRDLSLLDLRNQVLARTTPQVLVFFGAFCPSCRSLMPGFVNTVRQYRGPARFSAVSVDQDRAAFEAYTPVLGGLLEPLWLRAERESFLRETRALGLTWNGTSGIVVPYVTVFDARGHVLRQGGSKELKRLGQTLENLAQTRPSGS